MLRLRSRRLQRLTDQIFIFYFYIITTIAKFENDIIVAYKFAFDIGIHGPSFAIY